MLDLKFIRDNIDAVEANISSRNMKADPRTVVQLYEERSGLIQELDDLRQSRNENAKKMKGPMDDAARAALVSEGKLLKQQISDSEKKLSALEGDLNEQALLIPNMAHPDAPVGKEEKDNLEIKRWGEIPQFDFPARDHVELARILDVIDFDAGTRVSGTKFYYLRNEGVFLEMALIRYALDVLQKHGFTPTITPDIAKEEVVRGIGFNPRGEESNIYNLEDTGTCLVGTAEITLGGYHAGDTLDLSALPVKMAGVSHCFRREAGAAGQFSKGLYRVHQFTKVEMFVYADPQESGAIHEQLREIEEEIFQGLGISYRVVDTCTGDLGASAYRKYDLEAWMPGRGDSGGWGEITSTSNCTDYQARRLNVRFKGDGRKGFVHMLNGTAIANSRAIVSILENYQQADGSVKMPEKLIPYLGFDAIHPKST